VETPFHHEFNIPIYKFDFDNNQKEEREKIEAEINILE